MKRFLDIFLRAVMTGFAIGMGGTVYLSCDNKYIGAFLFGTGLFVILTFGFNLFTGKVGYAVENAPSYLTELVITWVGNLLGTMIIAGMILYTRIAGTIIDKVHDICAAKLRDSYVSILILSFLCGMLMFIAADGYKKIENTVGKILAIFLPVMVFILSGYEHCVANMFYFTLAGVWSLNTLVYMLIMTMGNTLGGCFIPLVRKLLIQPGTQTVIMPNSDKKNQKEKVSAK